MNSHTNNKGQLPDDCVLIACVQANSSCNFREEQFSDNCDIVCLKPSLEEWRQWMSSRCNPTVLAQVLSFIKTNGIELDYLYLGRIISALEYTMESRKLQSIEQLSSEDFKLAVCGIAPGFSTDNFWKFIQTQNNNNHE